MAIPRNEEYPRGVPEKHRARVACERIDETYKMIPTNSNGYINGGKIKRGYGHKEIPKMYNKKLLKLIREFNHIAPSEIDSLLETLDDWDLLNKEGKQFKKDFTELVMGE